MTDVNPYQPPIEAPAKNDFDFSDHRPCAFTTDWSPEGLHLRRKRPWHVIADRLMIVWVAIIVLAVLTAITGLSGMGGSEFLCCTVPLTIYFAVLYGTNYYTRRGTDLRAICPGLAGTVHGTIIRGMFTAQGPACAISFRVADCRNKSSMRRLSFSPRMFNCTLDLIPDDIRPLANDQDRPPAQAKQPTQLLSHIPNQPEDSISVDGFLNGRDFAGLSNRRKWFAAAAAWCGFGLVMTIYAGWLYSQLAPHVIDPPSHYRLAEFEQNQIAWLVFIGIISLITMGIGLAYLWQTRRKLLRFAAFISPICIGIANKQYAINYFSDALQHFIWTDAGLAAVNDKGTIRFLIPTRLLTHEQISQIAQWYPADRESRFTDGYFLGPGI